MGWIGAFADLQIHVEKASDADHRVMTELHFVGHGTESGAPLDELIGFIFSLRAGRVTKVEDMGRDQASTK
jgi:ketosteroid isomerase-like protein